MTQRSANGARPLPGPYYTSDEIFSQEQERIFASRWICVGRSDKLDSPGDYLRKDFGRESALIVRGPDNVYRAFHNLCRHRGTRLCDEHQGRFSGSIQCPYHAWTYSLEGRLIGAPHMRNVRTFNPEDYPLFPVAVQCWEGFLFLNLSPNPEAFESSFAPILDRFQAWNLARLRTGETTLDVYGWK